MCYSVEYSSWKLSQTCDKSPDPHARVVVGQGGVAEDVEARDDDEDEGAEVLRHHGDQQGGGPGHRAHLRGDPRAPVPVAGGQLKHPEVGHESESSKKL